MIVNMTQKLMGVDGKPLKDPEGKEIILRTVVTNALGTILESDKTTSGEDKCKIWQLAVKVQEDKPDIDVEDLALIKKRIGEAFGPMVVGPAYLILNGTQKSA